MIEKVENAINMRNMLFDGYPFPKSIYIILAIVLHALDPISLELTFVDLSASSQSHSLAIHCKPSLQPIRLRSSIKSLTIALIHLMYKPFAKFA